MLAAVLTFALIGAIGLWQLVGTWRASSKQRSARPLEDHALDGTAPRDRSLRAGAVRALDIACWPVAVLCGSDRHRPDRSAGPRRQHRRRPASFSRATCPGACSMLSRKPFATTARFETVVLNSPGGHYAVGRRIGCSDHGAWDSTRSRPKCAAAPARMPSSAATADSCRKARSSAITRRPGIHLTVLAQITAHATKYLNQANVPEDFIGHVFATPSDSVWFPTLNELRQANIVTDVVK